MASDNEASCASDPNFAVICSFLGCFGKSCGILYPDIARLQEMLENTQEVSRELIDLHIKLLRKTRKSVSPEKWERALVKFCHTYSNQDGWELERFGYKKARIAVKLRLLKVLLETQFDLNQKFKNEVNKLAADELRVEPLGRDKSGLAYWCQLDEECNIRVYREDLDEENWELVAKDRDGVVNLISTLSNGEAGAIPINEDSNSLEISEKPITDTGQVSTSPSLEDEVVQENGIHANEMNGKQLPNGKSDEFEDEQENDQDQDQDNANEAENDEEDDIDAEEEEDVTNDESSKQITEEDDSQEMVQTSSIESRCINTSSTLLASNLKTLNMKLDGMSEDASCREATDKTLDSLPLESKPVIKQTALTVTDTVKSEVEESAPLKSIETPVITSSPLKLVNISELKQTPEDKLPNPVAPLNVTKRYGAFDEMTDPVMKSLEKLSGKSSASFSSTDSVSMAHSKLSLKPIDQLAANLVRIQSEKLEKPSGPKSLEKIAESLARSGGILANAANGEDDRLPQDFCSRNQSEKSTTLRGHRGIDLSTSPRGWESASEQNRPVDFSGIDLSSRKLGKTMDLPSPGYRTQQDFQHREMDLSTKKLSKPEAVPNMPYDARSVMMRNHAMVADLSKRQMPFTAYEMSSTPYHNTARLSVKDEHRLPSYTILPDPSKITSLRMNSVPLKRPLESDDVQQDMLKRIRADVIPIRGSIDKRPMMSGNWRDEVSETIEEPMMMVQGEGSGSDCEAVNPIVGEAVEEPTIFVYGEGSGAECETGNPGDDTSTDNKESNESKTEPDSATATLSQNKVLTENEVSTGSIVSNKTPVKLNRNYPQSNLSVNDNCQIVDSVQEKPKFKHTLGVQIIPKSTTGPVKRISRWDVGKPEEKAECDSSIISHVEGDISLKKENTNDHKLDNAEQKLPNVDTGSLPIKTEDSADINQDVKTDDNNSVNTGSETTIQDSVKLQVSDESLKSTSTMEQESDAKPQESVQCDSSVSSCQPDISQTSEQCTNSESSTVDSGSNVQKDSNSVLPEDERAPKITDIPEIADVPEIADTPKIADVLEIADNECKSTIANSPPRFFFGPNCISYTSKPDESEQNLSSSAQNKTDTVQYDECDSSSKPVDETVYPYKDTEDFELTQTNNNLLKTDLFTSDSDSVPCENDSEDVEKIEAPSNTWDQQTTSTLNSTVDVSECDAPNSSIEQVSTEASEEPSAQESVCTSKEMEENDFSKTHTSRSETTTENESINDISMAEEDSIKISAICESNVEPIESSSIPVEPVESATVEPSQCQSSQSTDSETPESIEKVQENIPFEISDDITSQLSNDKEDTNEKSIDDCKIENNQSADLNSFKEDEEKFESVAAPHSSSSFLTQDSQANVIDLKEFEDNNSNELLDSTNVARLSEDYQEANSLQKNDLDSAGESCDKQSDKNDNFSEIDGQEDHSTDTDNEKMKGLVGSDVDSLCVNYDKNSERTDVLSDVGLQDDGSGDSEEIKEKGLNDLQVNDTVFDMNPTVTVSEAALEENKDDLVPTISSSDDVSVQDSASQQSEPVQMDGEKVENTSSVIDEPSTFDLPEIMPETNIFQLSKSDIVETTKETNLSDVIQATSESVDDVSENPSSCIDQDSNEEMVIDDRVSESNELFKETEEVSMNDEQPKDTTSEITMDSEKEAPITNIEQESSCQIATEIESCQTTTEAEILEEGKPEVESQNDKECAEEDESKICNIDEQDMIAARDISVSESKEIVENVEKLEINTSATTELSDVPLTNIISQESQQEVISETKQSLVANYESDSNDGSDNVFEPDVAQSDSKEDAAISMEQKTSEELHEKPSVEEDDISNTNLVFNTPQEESSKQAEEFPETEINEELNEDVNIINKQSVDETKIISSCNIDSNIENCLNNESTIPLNKEEFQEKTDICDISITDSSKTLEVPDATESLVAPVMTEEITEPLLNKSFEPTISHSEKSKERFNNLIDNVKTVQDTVDEVTEKKDCLISENVCHFDEKDADKLKSSFTQESTEFNAVDNQVTSVFNVKEQPDDVKDIDEKLNVSLDAENIVRLKNVNEHVAEELPIPCKRFKEDLTDYAKDNKWDVKLQEECLTKPFVEEVSLPQTGSDIVPAKLDNALAADKSHLEDAKLEESVSSDALYYPNSMSTKVENVNNLDSSNQNEPFSVNLNVNKSTENFSAPLTKDESTIFFAQETISEVGAVKSDIKKEASKRVIDTSDAEDVPPLKSKPPYLESDEKTLENLVSTEETFKNLDNEPENLRPQVKEEAETSVISTTQLFQNDFATINDSTTAAAATEDSKVGLEVAERKEESVLEIQNIEMKTVASDSDSTGVDNEDVFVLEEADPLACANDDVLKNITEDETLKTITEDDALKNITEDDDTSKISIRIKPVSDIVYEGWKLDSTTETPKISRKRRNSTHESNSEDAAAKQDEEMIGSKRMKLRAKRVPDKDLRKSIEESRVVAVSSEDEAAKCDTDNVVVHATKDGSNDPNVMQSMPIDKKIRGRPRGKRRRGFRGGRSNRPKHAEFQGDQTSEISHPDGTSSDVTAQKKRKKRKMVLGLEIGRDISLETEAPKPGQDEAPVRQSRRIAQLKIKEQADRRRIEEETMRELEEKKESEKKKRKKQKPESEEEYVTEIVIKETEKEKKSKKKRRKRKKKKMLAKFNEANPWQSSSGSSSDEEDQNEDEDEEDEDIESEGSLLFKSDHEFSPESDLEKDQESEPLRRARTAQKAQSDVEEAEDEYACQKCGKADHPEWILLCDSCDKGWHCSCLRPALMLIPEGDWFCPPCQHTLLVTKLQESLKTHDQLLKRHENEQLRKKRLDFVGISLDNVLPKGKSQHSLKGSKASSQEDSDNDSSDSSGSSGSSSETSSSEESEPVYQLRERRCANTYKFNEYDDMINAAIQDEVEAVQGAGNQGRGKDIATIVNAEKEEAEAEALKMTQLEEDKDDVESKPEKESDEEYKIENEDDMIDEIEEKQSLIARKLLARKKHRKLNSLDISSEDDPDSDEDFKGTSSDDEEDFDDHMTSSDDSFANVKRRGRKGDLRPVRRSTRARMTRAYDKDFINDDSDESDRPKRKKSRSVWGDSDSEDSDNSWRQRKKKSRTITTSRIRTVPKTKGKKRKKRKRIIESDNQSDNDEEDEPKIEEQCKPNLQDVDTELNEMMDISKEENFENNTSENNVEMKVDTELQEVVSDVPVPQISQPSEVVPIQKIKKDILPKPKKAPTIRRKIVYGGLPDENKQKEDEILGRRTRGRKMNYREEMGSDSEEDLKKALMKKGTGESEDEFVVNEGDDVNDNGEKEDSDSDVYVPKKDALKFKNKSLKTKKRNGKSPGAMKRKSLSDDMPKQRKKPGPKPGSKNRARKQKLKDDADGDMISAVMDNPMGDIASKMDDNLPDNVNLTGTTMSVASSFTGDVPEGSLSLGAGELADLDEDQLEQMMMDEEYGRRQLELAAIEIAKKKKKEEREAKKLEKARLKALEILAAERQRDPNAPEGMDGEAPKKKKRGRRSKAEILAEQMRRDNASNLGIASASVIGGIDSASSMQSHTMNPASLSTSLTSESDRSVESGHMPLMTGPDGQLFNPDGTPMRPKRRGRGKGKKTLALEAARAAEAAAKAVNEVGLLGMGTDSNPEMKDIPNILPTPGSSTSGSAPSTPPASAVPTPGPPSTQSSNSQSVYPSLPSGQQSSVITRMLQSQPVSNSPQSFTAAAAAMGHKYFGGPNVGGQMMGGPRTGYEMQPRARIPSPYRQAGQSSMPPHFAAVRSGTPPMRMRVPGPQMYHTSHHPMDPSPSGGGPISINNRDRSSPLAGGPAMIPPSAGSPLAKGGPTPPPPPYVRGGPPMSRFAENPMGPRHQMPPFTNASPVNHNMQQPSPPPNRPPGNFSPYHPPPPPNYHYGAYPPPPPMSTADDAAAYQGSPYPSEHFSSPADNQVPPIQGPPPPQAPPPPQQAHPGDPNAANKQYDEEGTGEFGGLVSYFSSQREDDLES